jgi:hypothetical protein
VQGQCACELVTKQYVWQNQLRSTVVGVKFYKSCSIQLVFEVVNAETVNISDEARSTQTRQRSGISSDRRIQEVSRRRFLE